MTGWISIDAATQSGWYIDERIAELINDVIAYSKAFYTQSNSVLHFSEASNLIVLVRIQAIIKLN